LDAHVGGATAQQLDLADLIAKRLPLIIGVVVALSILLLMIALRSVVAPLQAAVVNLAVCAAYGIVTAVFQDGLGDGDRTQRNDTYQLVRADDEVRDSVRALDGLPGVLLSRMREEIDAGASARQAVIRGLAGTGKVIGAARSDHGRGVRQLHPQRRPDG
jgi:RND superfamily putative drug exporter